jgi:hypothetical protein
MWSLWQSLSSISNLLFMATLYMSPHKTMDIPRILHNVSPYPWPWKEFMTKLNWQLPVLYMTSCQYSRVLFRTLLTSLRQYLDYEHLRSEDFFYEDEIFSSVSIIFHLNKLNNWSFVKTVYKLWRGLKFPVYHDRVKTQFKMAFIFFLRIKTAYTDTNPSNANHELR